MMKISKIEKKSHNLKNKKKNKFIINSSIGSVPIFNMRNPKKKIQ